MAAAITAARSGADVTILEQKERLGKKILSTGNGRCNLTNEYMDISCFRGEDIDFVKDVLKQFGYQNTLDFFHELGVLTKSRGGYIYPRSDQATTILEAMEQELKRLGVKCQINTKVLDIQKNKKGFSIYALEKIAKEVPSEKGASKKGKKKKAVEYIEKNIQLRADRIILAAGGKAASVLGSDGSGYTFAKAFGHSLTPVVPALVQLRSEEPYFKQLTGIRTEGTVQLYIDDVLVSADTGEIQLTDYGISGIPVFQVSRFAALGLYKKQKVHAVLDFMPGFSETEFAEFLRERLEKWSQNTVEEYLSGIFNKKMIPVLLEKANTVSNQKVKTLSKNWCQTFAHVCKYFEVQVCAVNSFEQAQVCAGGVKTTEIDSQTMESKYVDGLYLTGELLDVDGICGGYNLQWAWATGTLAGKAAAI